MSCTRLSEDMTIGELLAACRAGDPEAWPTLVRSYAPLVWSIARSYRLSMPDCEEVFQQAWLYAYQSMGKLHSPERFSAWLTTCVRRESLRQYRRSGRYVPVGDTTSLDRLAEDDGPEALLLTRERRDQVLAAFRQLPARDQALLGLLSSDAGHTYDQVSSLLGIPRGSVGPLRARALRRLAGHLAATGMAALTAR